MRGMMGQPLMMPMAGGMPVNIQQPMENFGFGNNMSFYRANNTRKMEQATTFDN